MQTHVRGVLSAGILVALAGCSSATPEPVLQTGPEAEVTIDGLTRVDNARVAVVYQKADADFTPYTKFILDPVEVAYQKDPGGRTRSTGAGASPGNYQLTSTQMETLKRLFREAVVEALTADGGYELTTERGPDVLRITAELVDLIVSNPTENTAGRQQNFTRSYGEVTLIMELRDAQSGDILVRAAERRDPTRDTSGGLVRVSSAFAQSDVRRMFQGWARILREGLDAIRT
jgi:hypothetical protein